MIDVDRDGWRRLLAQLEAPAVGAVAEALADARDLQVGEAYDAVEGALADGVLDEDPDAGAFGTVTLAPADGARESDADASTGDERNDDARDTDHTSPGDKSDAVHEPGPVTPPEGTPGDRDRRAVSDPSSRDTDTPEGDGTDAVATSAEAPTYTARQTKTGGWGDVDFTDPGTDTYPPALLEREQWMGHVDKRPFAPWGDADPDDADPDDSPRWEWGREENYVDGERVAMAEADRRLDGRVFLQQDTDPFAFVDGDDVRDPDTGEVHPAFVAILEHLGITYADVSTSGAGAHAYYRAPDGLPIDGKAQADFELDTEPWGANDDPPTVEIYANKHVCVVTGEHLPGTPTEVREWDDDALRAILEAAGYDDAEKPDVAHDTDRDRPDLDEHDPDATGADETTEDVRDVLAAVDELRPRDLPLRTQQVGTDATGWEKWDPSSYRSSSGNDSLHTPDREVFHDHKKGEAFGVLKLFALERGIISKPSDRLAGRDWWDAVDAARDAGAPIPEYVGGPDTDDVDPVAALPIGRLAALDDGEARRFARRRGVEWPDTAEVRERLQDTIHDALRDESRAVVDAPTSAGKSHQIAATAWRDVGDDVTGGAPVIHLHETRDARDEHARTSADELGSDATRRLLAGHEACPVAAGAHDPENAADDEDRQVITVDGEPASEWFDRVCRDRGIPFSVAHARAREHNDQGLPDLPCSPGEQMCPSASQYAGVPRNDDGDVTRDVIHATHQFAHIPSFRHSTNLVFDEQPDFTEDISHDRARRAVTAFLGLSDVGPDTWEQLVAIGREFAENDLAKPWNEHVPEAERADMGQFQDVVAALEHDAPREWYFTDPDAHTLAPAIARAVFNALYDTDPFDENGRATARTKHRPPRFDDDAREAEYWNREWVTVVVDDANTIRRVRCAPDLSGARAVIGLDAHPSPRVWRRNCGPDVTRERVLEPEERRLWRVFERELRCVQVGDAVRPVGSDAQYYDDAGDAALVERIRERFDLRSGVVPKAVAEEYAGILEDHGADVPRDDDGTPSTVLTYGNEKSRNDLAGERVGYVSHCIDPGDEYVLDWLAECGLDAAPSRVECPRCEGEGCPDCEGTGRRREHGRTFDGADADAAEAFLGTVREQHLVQSAGRYARDPDARDGGALVFVRSAALPDRYADLQVPGVEWLASDKQAAVVDALAEAGVATADDVATAADVTREHARRTLRTLAEENKIEVRERAGEHGAHLYRGLAGEGTEPAVVDLEADGGEDGETSNADVWVTSTWSLAVSTPNAPAPLQDTDTDAPPGPEGAEQLGLEVFDTPPPGD